MACGNVQTFRGIILYKSVLIDVLTLLHVGNAVAQWYSACLKI